jgi:hypothetical protein
MASTSKHGTSKHSTSKHGTIEEFGQHLDRNSAKVSFDLTSSSIETLEFILI